MQSVIQFFQDNQIMFASAGILILDFIFAIKPQWKTSGILHWIYVTLGGKKGV